MDTVVVEQWQGSSDGRLGEVQQGGLVEVLEGSTREHVPSFPTREVLKAGTGEGDSQV